MSCLSADPLVNNSAKHENYKNNIVPYLLLASSLYAGTAIISPLYGTGRHFRLHLCIGLLFSVVCRKRLVATS